LAWAVALGGMLLLVDWRRTLIGYGIGVAMVAVAFLGTNFWAHGDWRPPYSHRGLGPQIGTIKNLAADTPPTIEAVIAALDPIQMPITTAAEILPARLEGVQQVTDSTTKVRVAIKPSDDGWNIYAWDDWYDYPKSYWLPENKKGVDRGESDRWIYLFHFLIGHHGVLSLTPFWVWSIAGAFLWIVYSNRTTSEPAIPHAAVSTGWREWILSDRGLALSLSAVSLACVVFYTSRGVEDRNYAGVCSGFRWLFWLIPAWLWLSVPAVQWTAKHRWARYALTVALGLSILSATLPWSNPWTHPWPYRLLMWLYPDRFQ
jgi:hypothetical protein